jgi:hypothetical protein
MAQEARIAAGPGMTVICSSSDPQQLRALLTVFDPSTIRGVISFGVAGGLDPTLKSGDVVVATEVMAGDARWLAGLALNDDLIARVALGRRRVVRGGLAGVEEVIVGQSCKAALRSLTGAGEERDQTQRRHRSAQDLARARAQPADAARAGLDRH